MKKVVKPKFDLQDITILNLLFMISIVTIVVFLLNYPKERLSWGSPDSVDFSRYENKVNNQINYPYFNNDLIDTKINQLIREINPENKKISYEIYEIDEEKINIFFTVGENEYHRSYLFDKNGQIRNISVILKEGSNEVFESKINEQIDSKYPKFIADTLKENVTKSYRLENNKMTIYFDSNVVNLNTTQILFIVLNYHEIRDILNITFNLDKEYQNENVVPLTNTKPTIALTFDDGPTLNTTEELLTVLKENKVNATFFMLGSRIVTFPDTVRRMVNEGNEAGNHSYSHKNLAIVRNDLMLEEVNSTFNVFKEITGTDMNLIRPPYGSYNARVKNSFASSFIMWSVDTRDWADRDAMFLANYVLETIKDGDIVLFHDSYRTSIEAIKIILPELYLRGYQVTTVSGLANLKGVGLQPNVVYRSFK